MNPRELGLPRRMRDLELPKGSGRQSGSLLSSLDWGLRRHGPVAQARGRQLPSAPPPHHGARLCKTLPNSSLRTRPTAKPQVNQELHLVHEATKSSYAASSKRVMDLYCLCTGPARTGPTFIFGTTLPHP